MPRAGWSSRSTRSACAGPSAALLDGGTYYDESYDPLSVVRRTRRRRRLTAPTHYRPGHRLSVFRRHEDQSETSPGAGPAGARPTGPAGAEVAGPPVDGGADAQEQFIIEALQRPAGHGGPRGHDPPGRRRRPDHPGARPRTCPGGPRTSGHSCFPVCGDDLDDLIGVLFVNDLFRAGWTVTALRRRRSGTLAPTHRHLAPVRQPFLVPESLAGPRRAGRDAPAAPGLRRRRRRVRRRRGVLTVKDLLGALVGDLPDEFDPDEEPDVVRVDGTRWLVDGQDEHRRPGRPAGHRPARRGVRHPRRLPVRRLRPHPRGGRGPRRAATGSSGSPRWTSAGSPRWWSGGPAAHRRAGTPAPRTGGPTARRRVGFPGSPAAAFAGRCDGLWRSLVSALRSGRRGPRFKSGQPDHASAGQRGFRPPLARVRAARAGDGPPVTRSRPGVGEWAVTGHVEREGPAMDPYMVVCTFREGTDMDEVFGVLAEERAQIAVLESEGRRAPSTSRWPAGRSSSRSSPPTPKRPSGPCARCRCRRGGSSTSTRSHLRSTRAGCMNPWFDIHGRRPAGSTRRRAGAQEPSACQSSAPLKK